MTYQSNILPLQKVDPLGECDAVGAVLIEAFAELLGGGSFTREARQA